LKKITISLFSIISLLLGGCSPDLIPPLGGGYQSEFIQGYIIQMGIQPDDHTFVEYIDNREVDRGTYEEKSEGVYLFKSAKQEFEVALTVEDSFEIVINQMNDKKPIELKNVDKVSIYFSTDFDDVEEYKKLLDEGIESD
jgi:hypothetical protein